MKAQALDAQVNHINSMYDNHLNKFICQPCNKKYKTLNGMKKHLQKEHGMADLEEADDSASKFDHVAIYHASFMKCAPYYAIQMMLTKWGMAIEFSAIQNFKCCYQGREIIPNINCGYFDTWQTVSVFSPQE